MGDGAVAAAKAVDGVAAGGLAAASTERRPPVAGAPAAPGAPPSSGAPPSGGAPASKALSLPNAVPGKVVCRFSPEPSGYLHIGHAKAALLNAFFVRQYGGRLLLRLDDTNPAKEKMEFEAAILEDLALLEISPDAVSHTSDHFDAIEAVCERLLREGRFYCDDTPAEEMRRQRGVGEESARRAAAADENLRAWEEMKKGTPEGQRFCVRAKIDMRHKNKCLRDPVMYRCVPDLPHHRLGTAKKAYPTYDFACPLVDSLEGVTHAMRANEYADRIPQYFWVLEAAGLPALEIYEFSRLNLVNTVLSKRKLQHLVDTGVVSGWDDPRMPTVRGVRRRGLTVQALLDFITDQGASKKVNLMEWDKLWAKNKQILDPVVPRFFAVAADSVLVAVRGGPEAPEEISRPRHLKNPELGNTMMWRGPTIRIDREDALTLQEEGTEFTLMRWCNAIVTRPFRPDAANPASAEPAIEVRLNPEGDFRKTKVKAHWVCAPTAVPVVLREYDVLLTTRKPEECDDFDAIVNRDSLHDTPGLAEPQALVDVSYDSALQFERRGYYIRDRKGEDRAAAEATAADAASTAASAASAVPVFVKIPDGKSKAMSVVSHKVDSAKLSKGTKSEKKKQQQAAAVAGKKEEKTCATGSQQDVTET